MQIVHRIYFLVFGKWFSFHNGCFYRGGGWGCAIQNLLQPLLLNVASTNFDRLEIPLNLRKKHLTLRFSFWPNNFCFIFCYWVFLRYEDVDFFFHLNLFSEFFDRVLGFLTNFGVQLNAMHSQISQPKIINSSNSMNTNV